MGSLIVIVNAGGFIILIGGVLWKMGLDQGETRAMLRAHCRDIGILMRHLGIDPPPAPGRDDPPADRYFIRRKR